MAAWSTNRDAGVTTAPIFTTNTSAMVGVVVADVGVADVGVMEVVAVVVMVAVETTIAIRYTVQRHTPGV